MKRKKNDDDEGQIDRERTNGKNGINRKEPKMNRKE